MIKCAIWCFVAVPGVDVTHYLRVAKIEAKILAAENDEDTNQYRFALNDKGDLYIDRA